ncbi:MAG: hypothetical protein MN733_23395 [Nitrososphaera sp.]|nr:hypothetical protein [Nitrososphaera sp.]
MKIHDITIYEDGTSAHLLIEPAHPLDVIARMEQLKKADYEPLTTTDKNGDHWILNVTALRNKLSSYLTAGS